MQGFEEAVKITLGGVLLFPVNGLKSFGSFFPGFGGVNGFGHVQDIPPFGNVFYYLVGIVVNGEGAGLSFPPFQSNTPDVLAGPPNGRKGRRWRVNRVNAKYRRHIVKLIDKPVGFSAMDSFQEILSLGQHKHTPVK
jgi:hypothetical protein